MLIALLALAAVHMNAKYDTCVKEKLRERGKNFMLFVEKV